MKFISSIQGSVAVKYSHDEAVPNPTVLTRDLVAFIGTTYNFSLKPQVPPGLLVNPVNVFQTGELIVDDKKIPIHQLTLAQGAVVTTANNTDNAEIIADHIIGTIDEKFSYQINKSIRAKYYTSNITIDFDPALEQQFTALDRAQKVLEREISRPGHPFAIKRLAFGDDQPQPPVQQMQMLATIDSILNMDFVIERRGGESHSANRYFSVAPVRTSDHERILKMVEEAMRG